MEDYLLIGFVLLAAGVLAVPLATRFGLGSVLGYILAGVALGPALAALKVDVHAMQSFAEFGVVMMLFVVGLELEPKKLWAMRQRLLGLGGGQVVVSTLVLGAIAVVYGQPWQVGLAVGMILAVSSTAIVVQSLTEKGLLQSEGGQAGFAVLLMQDVAVIPMLALIPLLAIGGGAAGAAAAHGSWNLIADLPAWLSGLVTLAAIATVVLAGAYLVGPSFRFIAMANLREMFTAVALVFVIGISLLMALVGLSPALGAFLAGVVLANSEYRHELEADLAPFKGLLLGLFFMTVGAGIDLSVVAERWREVLFWSPIIIGAKIAVLLAIAHVAGIRRQMAWLFALSLAQAGEFAFVLIGFAVGNGVLPPSLAELLLLNVAMTMLATPLLFILYDKVIAPAYCGSDERAADEIDAQNRIIIAGRGRVGGIVERMLLAAGHSATVIDYDLRQLEIVRKFGYKSYFGDATRPDLLHSAGIADASLLVVALDEKEQIDKLVSYAIGNFPRLHVISRAIDRDHVFKLWSLGCRDIIRETYDSSLRMGRSAYEALGFDRQQAEAMKDAFERLDRSSMVEVADLYDPALEPWENEPLMERVKALRAQWDPMLREQMEEIMRRGR